MKRALADVGQRIRAAYVGLYGADSDGQHLSSAAPAMLPYDAQSALDEATATKVLWLPSLFRLPRAMCHRSACPWLWCRTTCMLLSWQLFKPSQLMTRLVVPRAMRCHACAHIPPCHTSICVRATLQHMRMHPTQDFGERSLWLLFLTDAAALESRMAQLRSRVASRGAGVAT